MSRIKRLIILIMCVALLSLSCGCTGKKDETIAGETVQSAESDESETSAVDEAAARREIYAAAYTKYAPDELIMTIGGKQIMWQEFYYWLLVSTEYCIENYGEIDDWSASDGKKTLEEYVLGEAEDVLKLYCAVELKAKELDVSISESDRDYLDSTKENIIEQYGGREAFETELAKSFMSEAVYDYSNEISVLYYNTFSKLFGESGELVSDEETAEFAQDVGYVRMKHIMLAKLNEDGTALETEIVAEKLKLAEDMLAEILSAPESERQALFDKKMVEYSEDPDIEQYPDGYLFVSGGGEMAEELDETVKTLAVGEICAEIVETEQGLHIVARLPVDPDTMVDDYYTLRYYAAYDKFEKMAANWRDAMAIEYSEAYMGLDLKELFPEL